jgi:hypothetical protein
MPRNDEGIALRASLAAGLRQRGCVAQRCAYNREEMRRTSQTRDTRAGSLPLLAVCILACLLFSSCASTSNDVFMAKAAVAQFHQRLDAQQYHEMYAAADAKLHQETTEDDFTKLMTAVHGKLGNVTNATATGWNVSWYAGTGTTVRLGYKTTFASGAADEAFVWRISGGQALLYGYNINSNDLIEK